MPRDPLPCEMSCEYVGRVSWPEDPSTSGAVASAYVCANPEHQHEAALWVEEITGHRGVFVAFKGVGVNG